MRKYGLFIGILVLLLLTPTLLLAQGTPTPITVGGNQLGEINATTPIAQFSFSANAGARLSIDVLSLSPELAPRFIVKDTVGAVYLSIDNATLLANVSGEFNVPAAGAYIIEVSSASGAGQFVVSLQEAEIPIPPPIALLANDVVTAQVSPTTPAAAYAFNASPLETLMVFVQSQTPNSGPTVILENALTGQELGTIHTSLTGGSFTIPPGANSYLLKVLHGGSASIESYQLVLVASGQVSISGISGFSLPGGSGGGAVATVPPLPTPLPAPATPIPAGPTPTLPPSALLTPLPSVGPCILAPKELLTVNIRSGPGTDNAIVAQLVPNQTLPVIGRLPDSSWWQVNVSGVQAWVAGWVVRLGGDCSGVPIIAPTPAPTPTPSPTPPPGVTQPDLIISSIIIPPGSWLVGTDGTIQVSVTNVGTSDAGTFNVRLTFSGTGVPSDKTLTVANLAAGASTTLTFNGISFSESGDKTVEAIADFDNTIDEISEGNNTNSTIVEVFEFMIPVTLIPPIGTFEPPIIIPLPTP